MKKATALLTPGSKQPCLSAEYTKDYMPPAWMRLGVFCFGVLVIPVLLTAPPNTGFFPALGCALVSLATAIFLWQKWHTSSKIVILLKSVFVPLASVALPATIWLVLIGFDRILTRDESRWLNTLLLIPALLLCIVAGFIAFSSLSECAKNEISLTAAVILLLLPAGALALPYLGTPFGLVRVAEAYAAGLAEVIRKSTEFWWMFTLLIPAWIGAERVLAQANRGSRNAEEEDREDFSR